MEFDIIDHFLEVKDSLSYASGALQWLLDTQV